MKLIYPAWDDKRGAWADRVALFDRAYAEHLDALRGVLPDRVLELAVLQDVENALIVEVRHDRAARVLRLVLRCGDTQTGYFDLAITYQGARITDADERLLARLARGSTHGYRLDLQRHEVDVTESGEIEHRLEFQVMSEPEVWLAIGCLSLDWETISRPDRELPPLADRFPDGPSAELVNREERERITAAWIAQTEAGDGTAQHEENFWAFGRLSEMTLEEPEDGADPEEAWLIILAIKEQAISEDAIALLAAGPMEDLLAHHGNAFIERVEAEARRNPRFNNLLGGVWRSSISEDVWRRVEAARGDVW